MNNIKTIISNHNKDPKPDPTTPMITIVTGETQTCAPWTKMQQPKHEAKVAASTSRETYIGLCDTTFNV